MKPIKDNLFDDVDIELELSRCWWFALTLFFFWKNDCIFSYRYILPHKQPIHKQYLSFRKLSKECSVKGLTEGHKKNQTENNSNNK